MGDCKKDQSYLVSQIEWQSCFQLGLLKVEHNELEIFIEDD